MGKNYTNKYFKYISENNIKIINDINDKLDSLDNESRRKFISFIRKQYPMSKDNYENVIKYIDDKYQKQHSQKLQNIKFINDIYDKLNIDNSRYLHWEYYFKYQQKIHNNTKNNSKPPRQDNKTYINYGSGGSNWPTIRYPKKCRKTAWKRFYKLFPHLKPKEE